MTLHSTRYEQEGIYLYRWSGATSLNDGLLAISDDVEAYFQRADASPVLYVVCDVTELAGFRFADLAMALAFGRTAKLRAAAKRLRTIVVGSDRWVQICQLLSTHLPDDATRIWAFPTLDDAVQAIHHRQLELTSSIYT
ncbi:MAG: hypothetical protein GYB68_08995 [Chloroflexi bacterium]|nr:hypothetical protein [Chloroflexota bacterium]